MVKSGKQGNYIVIAVEMLSNPFESMVINGNVAQSMTFNVYGKGNQPTDNIYFWVEMLTSPEIIIHLEIDMLQIRLTPISRSGNSTQEGSMGAGTGGKTSN